MATRKVDQRAAILSSTVALPPLSSKLVEVRIPAWYANVQHVLFEPEPQKVEKHHFYGA